MSINYERVAESLSDRERVLLKRIPETGQLATEFWNDTQNATELPTVRELMRKGLAGTFGEATEFGLEVRGQFVGSGTRTTGEIHDDEFDRSWNGRAQP